MNPVDGVEKQWFQGVVRYDGIGCGVEIPHDQCCD
jgi:hypothetical protein